MANAKGVVFALRAVRKRREAAVLLDGVQLLAAPGKHLVRIGLVADIPHQAVVRRVVDVVQGDGQLDGAQARREVAAARADRVNQEVTQLRRQRRELRDAQRMQVGGRMQGVQ